MKESKKRIASRPRMEVVSVTKALCGILPTYIAALQEAFGTTAYPPEAFITRLLDDAKALEEMPQPATRRSQRVQTRSDMADSIPYVLSDAVYLEQYIRAAFPTDQIELKMTATTIPTNRKRVGNLNWTATKDMLIGMRDFIINNRDTLTEQGGMPAAFETQVSTRFTSFSDLQAQLSVTNIGSMDETKAIDTATEALYRRVLTVLQNLRAIYYTDRAMRGKFSYAALKDQAILGAPAGGIRGVLMDAGSLLPLVAAEVSLNYHNRMVYSSTKGRFEFTRLKEGNYTISIAAEGYEPIIIPDVAVQTSVVRTLQPIKMGNPMHMEEESAAIVEKVAETTLAVEEENVAATMPNADLEEAA